MNTIANNRNTAGLLWGVVVLVVAAFALFLSAAFIGGEGGIRTRVRLLT